MIRPRDIAPLAVLCLALALLSAGCGGERAGDGSTGWDSAGGPWQRLDLWIEHPRLDWLIDYAGPSSERPSGEVPRWALRREVGPLGLTEMRRPPEIFKRGDQSAGLVRILRQITGSRLVWTVELGDAPYLSVTPLLDEEAPCACTFRIGVRDAGAVTEVLRHSPRAVPPRDAAAVEIDLAAWAGQQVELLFQADAPAGTAAAGSSGERPWLRWASPAVYSRRPQARPRTAGGGPPNVILIGADTLRADHVGPFRDPQLPPWRGPSLTPALDRMAAESDVWTTAFSTFNATNPSFASIFTGLYGKNHGIYDLSTPLPPGHTTMAEIFDQAGYDTLALISAGHLGDHRSGLGQGFDQMEWAKGVFAAELPVEMAIDWIADQRSSEDGEGGDAGRTPFFIWLHLFDPHTPHTPPLPYSLGLRPRQPFGLAPVDGFEPFRLPGPIGEYEERFLAGHRDLYAGEVAYLDRQIDRLLGYLDSHRLLDETIVAFVADHGENLGDHGIVHRHTGLWDTTTHVPMMVRWAGAPGTLTGRRFSGLVQTIDLFPTLLQGAGLSAPASDGEPLSELTGDGKRGRPAIFSEHANLNGVTVRTAENRLTRSQGNNLVADGVYLYDLRTDPAEVKNLAGQGEAIEQRLADLLDRWLSDRRPDAGTAQPRELSDEERERLEALGYLGGS